MPNGRSVIEPRNANGPPSPTLSTLSGTAPLEAGSTRAIANRVDALVVACKADVPDWVMDELRERQSIADLAGGAELKLGEMAFMLKPSRRRDFYSCENADVRVAFDERAAGRWRVEATLRATYLATHSLADALRFSAEVCGAFGRTLECRLRRFDLAADYVGFPLSRDDLNRVATKRAKVAAFIAGGSDPSAPGDEATGAPHRMTEHLGADLEVTGFAVAPGNALMMRVYDKTTELALPGREQKRALEEARWRGGGWDGSARVTRVEFQHRGEVVKELRLRDPRKLEGELDAVWQHDVRWARLIDPSSATRRSRCRLDPRWEVVVATEFRHSAQPARRCRNRGGATAEHVLGAAMSHLAGKGLLQRFNLGANEDGEPLDEAAFVDRMTEGECVACVGELGHDIFRTIEPHVVSAVLNRRGPREGVLRLLAKQNALVARFHSVDDKETDRARNEEENGDE